MQSTPAGQNAYVKSNNNSWLRASEVIRKEISFYKNETSKDSEQGLLPLSLHYRSSHRVPTDRIYWKQKMPQVPFPTCCVDIDLMKLREPSFRGKLYVQSTSLLFPASSPSKDIPAFLGCKVTVLPPRFNWVVTVKKSSWHVSPTPSLGLHKTLFPTLLRSAILIA